MTATALLVVLGLATGASTLAGGLLALRLSGRIHLVLGLSAGAVLGVALFDLMPEAVRLDGAANIAEATGLVGLGFVAYLVLDRALLLAGRGNTGHRGHFGAASLTAHSVMDGLAIGLGFQASTAVGTVLAAAVLAHDFADGANTVNVSQIGGRRPDVARMWLIADAAAPLVGIGASRMITVPPAVLAGLIAVFSGFFLYIGASELLPESHHGHPSVWTTASTVIGIGAIWVVVRLAAGA
jgi:ZIP family zinc transporter